MTVTDTAAPIIGPTVPDAVVLPKPKAKKPPAMWTCPRCNEEFERASLPTVEKGKPVNGLVLGEAGDANRRYFCPTCEFWCTKCMWIEDADNRVDGLTTCQDCTKFCAGCDEPIRDDDGQCESCRYCHGCCTCDRCPACGDKEDSFCEDCENCSSCCTCAPCAYCGFKFQTHEELTDSVIGNQKNDDCDHCEHCGCECTSYNDDHDADSTEGRVEPGWRVRQQAVSIPAPRWHDSTTLLDMAGVHRVDPVESMCEFYLLDFITTYDKGGCAEFVAEARAMQEEIVQRCDPPFTVYVDMVVGGELRHHPLLYNEMEGCDRANAWVKWAFIREQVGPQALLDAAELMLDIRRGGYGGPPWAAAARIVYDRVTGKLDARTFVDRVFTMQHNGGSLLNKIRSSPFAGRDDGHKGNWLLRNPMLQGVRTMKAIGEAHDANPPRLDILLAGARREVTNVFERWWVARNKERRELGLPPEPMPKRVPPGQQNLRQNGFYFEMYFDPDGPYPSYTIDND
jgi:hypothetical protein